MKKRTSGGPKARAGIPGLTVLAATLLVSAACHKEAVVRQPSTPSGPDPKAAEYAAKGDELFQRDHLYGWRMAEDFYGKAHALNPTAETKDKLLLAQVLRLTREMDEDIPVPEFEKRIEEVCEAPADPRQQWLCDFLRRYSAPLPPAKPDAKEANSSDVPDFGPDRTDLGAYLYILDSQARGMRLPSGYQTAASEKFKGSPLFDYLNLRKISKQARQDLEQTQPDFAELFVFNGESQMQERRYREARARFHKTLELIPEYTRAINGLGNICLYVLEEYQEAQQQYETALKYDPSNTGALFGKGAVLHSVGKFADSNPVFDVMLASDLTRRGRVDHSTIAFYQGMARYYQAYNNYQMFEPQAARQMIDLAKKILPAAEQVFYFSGLLYFNANQMEPARIDFETLLKNGALNCDAYYYLGLIYLQIDESRAANYMLGMTSCIQSAITNLKNEIALVPKLDLEPEERGRLQIKLQQKLAAFRKTAADQINNGIKMIDLTRLERKELYTRMMDEILQTVVVEAKDTP